MESATTARSPAWEIFGEFGGRRQIEAASMQNVAALWETIQNVNWTKMAEEGDPKSRLVPAWMMWGG